MTAERARLQEYLAHILQAIHRIYRYTEDADLNHFLGDELLQDAVIRNLEVVGEACHNIERRYPDFTRTHPELPIVFAYEMRNALAHGYFKVDLEIVWKTIERDLPGLEQQILKLQH